MGAGRIEMSSQPSVMEIRIFSSFKAFKERPDHWIRVSALAGTKLILLKGYFDDFQWANENKLYET